MKLFALEGSRDMAAEVARHLGLELAPVEERPFEDGEHKTRPLVSVRGEDVYVYHSLHADSHQSVNDKLCRLLFFIGALKDASAATVTAVVPYLCYARKDQKSQPRDPVTTRYVAAMFEAVGADRVVTLDVHNRAAFQNAFRCRTEELRAVGVLAPYVASRAGGRAITIVSPDAGGMKRAEAFRQRLAALIEQDVPLALAEKHRSGGVVSGAAIAGDVDGRCAVIVDDIVATGTTLARAAAACRRLGASDVIAAATHGVFLSEANAALAGPELSEIVVTDSVPPWRLKEPIARRVTVLDTALLFAEAIRRLHHGESIVEWLAID